MLGAVRPAGLRAARSGAAMAARPRGGGRALAAGAGGAGGAAPPYKPTNIADAEGSPFFELGLKEVQEGAGRVRVRQHVNPLSSAFQTPTPAPDWRASYADPTLPLFVDCGCGPGRFLLLLARHDGRAGRDMNYLGLEIRQPLVERANKWAAELGLGGRVRYVFTNVSVSLAGLLASYPGPVAGLSAQFPDPMFKRRHRKRRMVQASVVQAARELLVPGGAPRRTARDGAGRRAAAPLRASRPPRRARRRRGRRRAAAAAAAGTVFLQSDVYGAAVAMRDEFEQHAGDVLELSPLHASARVFQWTPEQAAAEAAAAAQEQQRQRAAARQRRQGGGAQDGAQGGAEQQDGGAEQQQDEASEEPDGGAEQSQQDGGEAAFVSRWAAGGWLADNPLGVPTEREHYVAATGGRVYRVLLVKR
ncbi:trmB [Scenedesmus sp. PABB004]|nr:trmB [Scenedesmus sp. PABB004]